MANRSQIFAFCMRVIQRVGEDSKVGGMGYIINEESRLWREACAFFFGFDARDHSCFHRGGVAWSAFP